MRGPFRIHLLMLIAFAAVATSPACSSIRVSADEDLDLSSHRTWGWGVPVEPIDAAAVTPQQIELAHRLARQVRLAMIDRGFQYSGPDADLLVTPELRIRQRRSMVFRSLPDQYLPSHHDTPSYQFEGLTKQDIEIVEVSDLVVVVVDRKLGRIVWRGRFQASFEGSFAPHLDTTVAALMDPFPSAAQRPIGAPVARDIALSVPETVLDAR
jgi:hypothetical protein